VLLIIILAVAAWGERRCGRPFQKYSGYSLHTPRTNNAIATIPHAASSGPAGLPATTKGLCLPIVESRLSLIPCLRHRSAVFIPASCFFRIAMICSSVWLHLWSFPSARLQFALDQFKGATSGRLDSQNPVDSLRTPSR
jgi:hypothetical protein